MVSQSASSEDVTYVWKYMEPPAQLDPLIAIGTEMFLADGWIDMREVARRAGIGRATLYRRFGDRDALLGEVIWELSRQTAHYSWLRSSGEPRERILQMLTRHLGVILYAPGLRKLLARNADDAMRILTARDSVVERRLVEAVAELVTDLLDPEGELTAKQLAFAIVRIAESFCYADILAGDEPDVPAAMAVIRRLL